MTIIQVREGLAVAAAEGVNIPAEEADHILQKVIVVNLSIGHDDDLTCWQMCKTEKIEGDCQPSGEQDIHVRGRPEKEVSFMWMMMTVLTMYKKGS